MIRTTVRISGMICGMCEAHVNGAVRNTFRVRKVSSSRSKGETVIESDEPIDYEELRRVVAGAGYTVLSADAEETEKKTLFRGFRKR